jgi:hypothetical protein
MPVQQKTLDRWLGTQYGTLTVIAHGGYVPYGGSNKYPLWEVQCSVCKSKYSIPQSTLVYTKSCSACNPKRDLSHVPKERRQFATIIKRKYNLEWDEYLQIVEAQNGKCAICLIPFEKLKSRFVCIDHCHTTGKVRGVLCSNCNVGLGKFKDDKDTLLRAVAYL